ncbi:MAG TPA: beta-hexosaminidase, partial [Enterococcus sp.]|nr:beta-hexosaminidase [Enterococcus sp.]
MNHLRIFRQWFTFFFLRNGLVILDKLFRGEGEPMNKKGLAMGLFLFL